MSASPILLDDAAVRRFIIDGYLVLRPELPGEFHTSVYRHIEEVLAGSGNPRNNLLPRVPELQQVFDHPVVDGALRSILGPEHYRFFRLANESEESPHALSFGMSTRLA